jgi:putative flippase GtrA
VSTLSRLLGNKIVRRLSFFVFGLAQWWVGNGLLYSLKVSGLDTFVAYLIQSFLVIEISFLAYWHYTWGDRRRNLSMSTAFLLYQINRIPAYIVGAAAFGGSMQGISPVWGNLLALIAMGVVNFVLSDKIVFSRRWQQP